METMKKTKLLLLFACGTILFSCNLNIGQKSIDEYFRQDSIDALQIKGYSVKKISGKNKYYGDSTEIEYQSLFQILAGTKKKIRKVNVD